MLIVYDSSWDIKTKRCASYRKYREERWRGKMWPEITERLMLHADVLAEKKSGLFQCSRFGRNSSGQSVEALNSFTKFFRIDSRKNKKNFFWGVEFQSQQQYVWHFRTCFVFWPSSRMRLQLWSWSVTMRIRWFLHLTWIQTLSLNSGPQLIFQPMSFGDEVDLSCLPSSAAAGPFKLTSKIWLCIQNSIRVQILKKESHKWLP